jgi:anti-sigma factor RsiW
MTTAIPVYDCNQVYVLLYEYLDAGLSDERRLAIEAHLAACAHCHDVAMLQRQVHELAAESGKTIEDAGIKARLHRLLCGDQPTPAGSFPDPASAPGAGTPVAQPNAAVTEEDAAEARSQMAG